MRLLCSFVVDICGIVCVFSFLSHIWFSFYFAFVLDLKTFFPTPANCFLHAPISKHILALSFVGSTVCVYMHFCESVTKLMLRI